jgi:hypothetical protein
MNWPNISLATLAEAIQQAVEQWIEEAGFVD